MKNNVLASVVLMFAALLAGCAATPTVRDESRSGADLSRFSTVQVVVEASDSIRKQDGYDVTSADLLKEFIEAVKAKGKYSTVGTQAAGDRVVETKLTVTELNYVHGAARAAVGILAGRAVLKVTMTLRDKSNGANLGTITAEHSSSHLQGVFGPTTARQISAIALELASKL